jgi:superfamily II DNA or RNA helicase
MLNYVTLRQNQEKAIKVSIENDFESGVHYHCTGSGKSLIAINIILEYHKRYPTKNVMFICEHKSILKQHFAQTQSVLFQKIKKDTNFFLFDYSQIKNKDWVLSLNSSKYWGRPF